MEAIKAIIRDIPDFPKEGIVFKDITPLLADKEMFRKTVDTLKERYRDKKIDMIVGIEARGFIFSSALAYALGAGGVIIRKPGKLPYRTFKESYALEYGTDNMEIHQDALQAGQRVILVDDVLATGGTLVAAVDLIQKNFKVEIIEVAVLMELDFLKGREKLKGLPLHAMIHY